MGLGFVTYRPTMADPEPPQPLPFPIRIVSDPPPPGPSLLDDLQPALPPEPSSSKHDTFYLAWDKFLSVQSKRTKTSSRETRKLEEERSKVEDTQPDGLQTEENAAKSWEQAAEECRLKVEAIKEECYRLNQKYRDVIFDLEANASCLQSLNGKFPKAVSDIEAPPWIKRVEDIFDDPQFFVDGATATDVHQGSGGDCWFLAALMAVSAKKELIENLCVARDEKVGVYGFVFYRDGEWIYEVIDDKLYLRVGDDDNIKIVRDWDPDRKQGMKLKHDEDKLKETLQTGGEALYFSHCKSNETWLPLIEKAYAKAHGDYFAIEGGFASEGIEDLTGGVAVVINPEDIMDKERFWKEQLSQVNKKYLFGGGSRNTASRGFVGGHAYTVLETFEEGNLKLLKLRNPWGEVEWEGDWSDGSNKWTPDLMVKLNHTFGDDGVFWISYKDFLKHFPNINCVRLFDKEWTVAQQWTCVNVPWTVDYLDTRFELNVTAKGPIVIVLSQPDDRYFYGLRGRYLYAMHFRLYRQGEDEEGGRYLVRSMHNSGNETVFTRSVSAELSDLEPGKYSVVFKVTAYRTNQNTQEEAILKYATNNKEKLLHVGRRYDYAQTKGNLRAMEKANRREKREAKREKQKKSWKRDRRLNMQQRAKDKAKRKRIDDAMREQRKELGRKRKAQRERRRQRRADKNGEKQRLEAESSLAMAGGEDAKVDASLVDQQAPNSLSEVSKVDHVNAGAVEKADCHDVEDGSDEKANSVFVPSHADEGNALGHVDKAEAKDQPEKPLVSKSDEDGISNQEAISDGCPPEAEQTDANRLTRLDMNPAVDPSPDQSIDIEEVNRPLADLSIGSKGSVTRRSKGTSTASSAVNSTNPFTITNPPSRPRSECAMSDSDSDSDTLPEHPDDFEDDDFEWDSDIDAPVDSDTSSASSSRHRSKLDIFANDPWNAVCVLGLRVYSKGEVGIKVVKGKECRED